MQLERGDNGQRVSESNLGKGVSLLLATFKVYQGDGLQHLEVWQCTQESLELTSRQPFQVQGFVSPHFLQEDFLLQVYNSSCVWAMRELSLLHLHCEVFGCCRDLAQQLEPQRSCGVGIMADVNVLVLCRGLPVRRPLHLTNAPTTVLVWSGVMDQVFDQDRLDHTAGCMKDRDHLIFMKCLCPSLCWGQGFNSESDRHFMRVHHMHVLHGFAKAGFLGVTFTQVLEQGNIVKKDPYFSQKSGHVQCSMVHHLQQPQLFTIWVALWRRSAEIHLLICHLTGF